MTGLQSLAALIRRNGPLHVVDISTGEITTMTAIEYTDHLRRCGDCQVHTEMRDALTSRALILSSKAKTN
jgi:hypothetical protein